MADREALEEASVGVVPAHFVDTLVINKSEVTFASIVYPAAKENVKVEAVFCKKAKRFALES